MIHLLSKDTSSNEPFGGDILDPIHNISHFWQSEFSVETLEVRKKWDYACKMLQ